MASDVVRTVETLLASECEDHERRELTKLEMEIHQRPNATWPWLLTIEQASPALLERFLLYMFVRAFVPAQVPLETVLKPQAGVIAASIVALSRSLADPLSILTLLSEVPWSTQAMATALQLIQQIEDARVRQQVLRFTFSVIARWSHDATSDWVHTAAHVLMLGVTDVWSAVRKESACAASKIVFHFQSLELIDSFINSFLKTAASDSWKAQEGALLTLGGLLSAITVDKTVTAKQTASAAAEMVKGSAVSPVSTAFHFGDRHRGLPQLPRSLASKLKPALYVALKHPQVSVRETAAQCLVQYMGICDESTSVMTFQEVMSKLNRLAPTIEPDTELLSQSSAELLEAAEAEGLLDVLGKLVPHVPVRFLVKHWTFVFPTLERYVMHVASSVRLRSSAVVLALAELAQQDASVSAVSLELLHQMVIALADYRVAVGVCWQRLEGRLLSVDLLVGLLGKDHVCRQDTGRGLLHCMSNPRKSPSHSWLPNATAQATWTIDEEETSRLSHAAVMTVPSLSIIDRLNDHVVSKKLSSGELWQRVLSGWLSQTRVAFESRQFELRRIARQVLPGLVRLSLWCNQVSLLTTGALETASADAKPANATSVSAWSWTCLRHLLLHAELIRACTTGSTDLNGLLSRTQALAMEVLDTAHGQAHRSTAEDESEAVVARVEAVVMATLSFGQSVPTMLSIDALDRAFLDIHASLPEPFHHPCVLECDAASSDASLDRQFSIALVQLLPAIVKHATTKPYNTKLWWITERITLSWLATDDLFRWITIDRTTAHALLLLTLAELLVQPHADALVTNDAAFIVRTLESAVAIDQQKDAAVSCLVRIYATMWRCLIPDPTNNRIKAKIVKNLALLDAQRRSSTAKAPLFQSVKSSWDDWDGDGEEDETESPPTKLQELRPLSSPNDAKATSLVASELVRTLKPPQLDAFRSSLDHFVHSDDKMLASCRPALQGLSSSLTDVAHS